MPQGTRVAKCVNKLKIKHASVNPYAVCQSATHQSYATGKKIKTTEKKVKKMKAKAK